MRIALIGYGKMGKMIESIAVERGHEVVLKIDETNLAHFNAANLNCCHVAIEFTSPHSAFNNVLKCLEIGVPVISGSTGWNKDLPVAEARCQELNGTFLHSSNFSIGVNVFFQLNKLLARLMAALPDYDVSLKEIHHTEKKDAPSGTAVTLAEQILEQIGRKTSWVNGAATAPEQLSILSERTDPAPGTHHVHYSSVIDDIEIIHTAHNRKGFALGAVMAAEFIVNKKGIYTMTDVLGL